MAKASKATQTADRAADIYSAARENPYVQRLIEDAGQGGPIPSSNTPLERKPRSARRTLFSRRRARSEPGSA